MTEHTINQLSALSGLPVRTIRFYLAQGLIPPAGREGPSSRYPEATLARLRLIARLRDAHLPLAEIRRRLDALSDAEVLGLAGAKTEPEPAGTALDYVRSVLGGSRPELGSPPPVPAPAAAVARAKRFELMSAPAPAPASPPFAASQIAARELATPLLPSQPLLARVAADPLVDELPAGEGASTTAERTEFGQRSQWERVAITSDIELHVRRPLSRRDNRLVDRLLAFARQLGEEQP